MAFKKGKSGGEGCVVAVCLSETKGVRKERVPQIRLKEGHGVSGDGHAGSWHRQVSLISFEKVEDFRAKGASVIDGDFGENIVLSGIDLKTLPLGILLRCGAVLLKVTQIGKECHAHCSIYHTMGDCIMPREGIFARVLNGGVVKAGDVFTVEDNFCWHTAVLTASDKGYAGERVDTSGPLVREILENEDYIVVEERILPDDYEMLRVGMSAICDETDVDLLVTTGGTGFSPRDCMPEVTMEVVERLVPGIPEAMRMLSMQYTKRAMLSRSVCGIRGNTLILNLPGSPRAARENLESVLPVLSHGLDMLSLRKKECASFVEG